MTTIERQFKDAEGTVVTVKVECAQSPTHGESPTFTAAMMAAATEAVAQYIVLAYDDPFKIDAMVMKLSDSFKRGLKGEVKELQQTLDDAVRSGEIGD